MNNNITKKEKDYIINEANQMINGYYHFDGTWDMEPCLEYIKNDNISFNITYNDDYEWSYMFTRMDYLYKFIYAYEISNDIKFINHGFKIIDKWYKVNNKYLSKIPGKLFRVLFKNNSYGYRTLDLGLLITNITDFIIYCRDNSIIDDNKNNHYKNIIIKTIKYLYPQATGEHNKYHNWVIQVNAGILYSIYKLDITNIIDTKEIEKRLIKQVNSQILEYGYHVESSPLYLGIIVLDLFRIMNCSNSHINNKLIKPLKVACDYLMSIRKNDNTLPNIGDSDCINISDIMIIASNLLKDKKYLKYVNKELDLEYVFKYGINRIIDNNLNISKEIIDYPYQNIYRDSNTFLLCSNTPKIINGHKHFDYLSVYYVKDDIDILIDLGRYSYKNDDKRELLVGPKAHNTINLINKNGYEYINSFNTIHNVECEKNKIINNKDFYSIKMECMIDGVKVIRYVTYIDNNLIITDNINESIEYEIYFNIGVDNKIKYYNDQNIKPIINNVIYSKSYNQYINIKQLTIKTNKKYITHVFSNNSNITINYNKNNIEYIIDEKKYIIPIR